MKDFLKKLGFSPKDNTKDIYIKKYNNSDNYIIEVDFENKIFDFGGKILIGKNKTQNITKPEDWVVFECVNRLLEKGYYPEDIVLEKVYPTGHGTSGRLDVLVKKEGRPFLMIECKTWGQEYEKELKNMYKDGGQLFTYFQQDRDAEYLMLYSSTTENLSYIGYKNEIVKVEDHYKETSSVIDFYDRWNKITKQNGVFEDSIKAYCFESKALIKKDLKPIGQKDASIIFNSFLEILRKNTVSDKPNAFNKIFTLFLCKIYDEGDKKANDELDFQWIEGKDNHVDFQLKLTDLYKKGMRKLLEKEVTDLSNDEFNAKFGSIEEGMRNKLLKEFNKIRLEKNNEFAIKDVFDKETFVENAIVLKEVVELLQTYQIRYEKKQPFLGDFFELLLTTGLKQEAGQFFTPVPVAKFICKSIPIKKIIEEKLEIGDSKDLLPAVIDYAAGSGHFLTESMEEIQDILKSFSKDDLKPDVAKSLKSWGGNFDWAYDYMYGIENDYRLVKTAKVGCFLHGDGLANVIHGDGLDSFENSKKYRGLLKKFTADDKKENAKFDLVLSNPPYSIGSFKSNLKEYAKNDFKLYEKLTEQGSEIECLFIERTSQLLKEGGIAGIVLPSSILSNTGIYTKAREIILKDFDIVAITELGSNTFMATGTNTVTLFLRKRNKFFAKNLENLVNKFFVNFQDVILNGIEHPVSKYVSEVWEGVKVEDYITLLQGQPNETIKNHEIFKDYKSKIKLTRKKEEDKQKEFFDKIIEIEKEKLLYFVITQPQQIVLVKSGKKKVEKEFLGYKFSDRGGHQGISAIFGGKKIDECTKLFDAEISKNPEKASTYIYDAFNLDYLREIDESLKNHIFRLPLVDMIKFNSLEKGKFEKKVLLNIKKKEKLDSKWEIKKLGDICEIKIGGTPSRGNYDFWENGDKLWLSISEINGSIINDTKEKINDLGIKKSNVKLIKKGTTLLSFKLSIGKTAIAGKDLYTNEAIAGLCLENEKKILNRYLFSLFNSKFIDLEKGNFNTFGKSLNSTFLKEEVLIPLPPKDIQQNIVDEIGELENIEERNLKMVGKLAEGIKESISNNSKLEKLENIKTMLKRGKSPKYGDSMLQIIKSGQARGYKEFNFSDKYFVSEDFIVDERKLEKGDVLINSSGVGTAGRVTLFDLDGDFVVDSHISILRLNQDKVLPLYVLYSLANIGFKNIEKMALGQSGQIELSIATINNIKIPLPSLEIQKKIVAKVEVLEKEIEKLKEENNLIPSKKQEILKKYL